MTRSNSKLMKSAPFIPAICFLLLLSVSVFCAECDPPPNSGSSPSSRQKKDSPEALPKLDPGVLNVIFSPETDDRKADEFLAVYGIVPF